MQSCGLIPNDGWALPCSWQVQPIVGDQSAYKLLSELLLSELSSPVLSHDDICCCVWPYHPCLFRFDYESIPRVDVESMRRVLAHTLTRREVRAG